VAIDDSMVQVIWTRHFLAAQSMFVPTTTIYQDNKSTILLAENVETAIRRYTRHVNVRYFLSQTKSRRDESCILSNAQYARGLLEVTGVC